MESKTSSLEPHTEFLWTRADYDDLVERGVFTSADFLRMTARFPLLWILAAGVVLMTALGLAAEQPEITDPLVAFGSARTWTATDGRELKAAVLSADDQSVTLRLANRKEAVVELSRLSVADRDFVAEWRNMSRYFNLTWKPSRNVSNTAQSGLFDGAFAKEGKVHESRHFRFECDASLTQEVVQDFARLFEATYAAIEMEPFALAIVEPERGKFLVKLFSERADYHDAGGLPNSAGIYLVKENLILVPLESLGVTYGSNGYKKTRDYDPGTLMHETAHALMHQWLEYLPMWFIEGIAEYVAAIPYRDGTLDLSRIDEGVGDRVLQKWKDRSGISKFTQTDPQQLVEFQKAGFMGYPEADPELIELTPVEPMPIVVKNQPETGEDADGSAPPAMVTGSAVPMKTTAPGDTSPPLPPVGKTVTGTTPKLRPDLSVSQRYTSSMLLVHHVLRHESPENLRRFLLALMEGRREREQYLEDYQAALKKFDKDLEAQVDAYNAEVRTHRAAVDAYNDAVRRNNAGEKVTMPPGPVEPVVPDPLPVPEILAKPRSGEELSDPGIRAKARRFLTIPRTLEIPGKR